MVRRNPFAATDRQGYLRGECAAENIYLACLILAQRFGRTSPPAAIDQPAIYLGTLELLGASAVRDSETDQFVRYFNRKIWSGNKYTPFDDAYWARGAIRDRHPGEFACLTLGFLLHEGISHTQTATGEDEVAVLDSLFEQFNASEKTAYRLLAHTAHGYASEAAFDAELHRILRHFEIQQGQPPQARLVGIDLLGMETATGLYRQFFDFLLEQAAVFRRYLDGKPETRKVVLHIHCGEGTGVSDDNRSLCGYFLRNANALDDFYAALSAYAWKCYGNTIRQGKARLRERENLQDRDKAPSALAGLFDELFFGNSLTSSGLRLRRFDITSGTTQALVAYYARTNVVNLCQALASRDADGNSYYRRLLESDLFSLRIGHAYYYRNYLASKFPELCFDTNLGSNFITGASGLFDSLQEYRLNRGLRHLDGYVGTDQLKELSLAIAYQGEQRLDPQQMQYVHALAESQSGFDELGEHLPGTPGWAKPALEQFFVSRCALYRSEEDRYFSSKPTGASSPRSSTGAPICWAPTARVSSTPTYRTKRSAWRSCSTMPPRTATAGYRSLRWRMPNACWCNWAAPTGRKPSAPSTWPARPIGTESCSASKGSPPPPRSCASPPAAVEERPMSAYARYIRRRALAAADRPAQRSPDASEETRDQPPPAGRRAESACWKYRTAMRPSSWPC